MAHAAESFSAVLSGAEFSDAAFPVLSNTDPEPSTDAEILRGRLARQITSPVRWTETMAQLAESGPTTLIECGPGNVLAGLAKRVDGLTALSVESSELSHIVEEVR